MGDADAAKAVLTFALPKSGMCFASVLPGALFDLGCSDGLLSALAVFFLAPVLPV